LEGLEEDQPSLDHKVDVLTWWVNNGAFSEAVRAALEETEVGRLMRLYRAQVCARGRGGGCRLRQEGLYALLWVCAMHLAAA
jgi:hypothetical protein